MVESCIRKEADINQIRRGKANLESNKEVFADISKNIELIGNEVRLKILYLLREEKELCVCDLSDILKMSVPAVSQHLRKMKDREMIESKKIGQTVYNTITPKYAGILYPILDNSTQHVPVEI